MLAKKRGHSEGSIRRRSDGTWEARYTVGFDNSGKQIQRSVYAKTRTEVATKLTLVLEKVSTGKYIDPSHMLLSDWMNDWLSKKKNKVKANTFDSYEQHILKHINPDIGHIKLKDLNKKHIQGFYEQKFEMGRCDKTGGLATASIIKLHNILKAALESAVNNRIIPLNPTKESEIPKGEEKERRVLSLEEQKAFINALENDRLEVAFTLEVSTGMRLGEVLGLTWDDINMTEKYLIVRRTLSRIKDRSKSDRKYLLIPQEPKTENAKRLIPIPDTIIMMLEKHKAKQEEEKLIAGELYRDDNIVFCTQLGTYIHPRNYMRSFYRLIEKAGIAKANVHSLRHTFATRMLEVGESAKVVQELLGHKNITTTLNTYTHVMENTKRTAMSKINIILTKMKTENSNETDNNK